jgi:Virulence factor BrkB
MASERKTAMERDEGAPEQPTKLPRQAWLDVLKRTRREFKKDNLADLAGNLTYHGVLAIFPMLIVLVSVLGLIGHSVTQPLVKNLDKVAPGPARTIFTGAIHNIESRRGTAGVLFIAGLVPVLVVGVGLHRGLHARLERHLGCRSGASNLEEDSRPPRCHTGDRRPTHALGIGGGVHRRPCRGSGKTGWSPWRDGSDLGRG